MTQHLEVRDLKVTSLDSDFLHVTWEVAPTSADVLDYVFEVLRSEAPEGPFEAISPKLRDLYGFADNAVRAANILRVYYYRLRTTHCPSGRTWEIGPVSHEAQPDLIAQELRRQLDILMREVSGRKCWVLPVRTMGQRCPACWNATLGKKRISGCISCYDTGFLRGFLRPIEAWVQFDPTSENEQATQVGKIQQQDTTARLTYYPPLKVGDYIIEPENIRWKVRSRATTQQLRAPVTQELQLHRVPPTDILYSLKLDLGDQVELSELYASPRRNFTNPQDIYQDEYDAPDYFNLFSEVGR